MNAADNCLMDADAKIASHKARTAAVYKDLIALRAAPKTPTELIDFLESHGWNTLKGNVEYLDAMGATRSFLRAALALDEVSVCLRFGAGWDALISDPIAARKMYTLAKMCMDAYPYSRFEADMSSGLDIGSPWNIAVGGPEEWVALHLVFECEDDEASISFTPHSLDRLCRAERLMQEIGLGEHTDRLWDLARHRGFKSDLEEPVREHACTCITLIG